MVLESGISLAYIELQLLHLRQNGLLGFLQNLNFANLDELHIGHLLETTNCDLTIFKI